MPESVHRPEGCICVEFADTGGFRIADLCCPVHGVGGTDPGDGPWPASSAPRENPGLAAAEASAGGCCEENGCRRQYPISLYLADFSGRVFAVTKRKLVGQRDDGTATFAATQRHDVTEQMEEFIRRNKAWVRERLEASCD